MRFTNLLIQWYLENKRDLPWRNTQDPYVIWLSEIMLQQTRVAQATPYFYNFTTAFPTVFHLANASEEQVLKLWQGLGYYSRARNLHKTAQYVANELNGVFPKNYRSLLQLKGVGDYTAAAIASFSYNEQVPVVDGNVFRVLSRYFDVSTDISSSAAKKEFQQLALAIMPKKTQGSAGGNEASPALFNQAIMEFGALQCVPKSPNCSACVMNDSCAALQKNSVNSLPVKLKKTKITNRFFNYLVLEDDNRNTVFQKRSEKGIWQNLYEFPLIETDYAIDLDDLILKIRENTFFTNEIVSIQQATSSTAIHKLTHQHLDIKFWKVKVKGTVLGGIQLQSLKTYPFPIVIYNFIASEYSN